MNRTDDVNAIKDVIQEYTDATEARDVARLKAIFHENATMAGYLGPNLLIGSPQPFYDHLAANEHGPGYIGETTEILVEGMTAVARSVEDNLYGMSFVNNFHLVKVDGAWKITAKLFHHDMPS